ncbi:MAG: endonuclease/exonuclease/phosphatase family protein [Clostridia bacterium]|nr:endonuclease/exonuclease/phosphatase family protein [Clostridia bacterium]
MNLSIATFNIQHGKDYAHYKATGEEKIDLKLMADTIRAMNVSVCGLNEVRNQEEGGLVNQAKVIGEHLGWNYAFVSAIPIKNGYYGNALVSRYPITAVKSVPIVTTPEERGEGKHFENRVLLVATVQAEEKQITVMSCHFGLNPSEMDKAVQIVLDEGETVTTPMVFMGDLNLMPDNFRIQKLREAFTDSATVGEGDMLTFPSIDANRKIDYIFAKNCKLLSSEVPQLVAADHLPIKAVIEL